jgi:antitoxin MazE
MQIQFAKWGNSLGLRLPRALAEQIGLFAGQTVNIVVDGPRLIIEPISSAFSLQDLLVNMTPDAMRAAFDWGEDAGREGG